MGMVTMSLEGLEFEFQTRILDPYMDPVIPSEITGEVVIGFIDHYGERHATWRVTRQEDGTFLVDTGVL